MFKKRSALKIAVTIVVLSVLYNEWIVYLIQPLYWNMPHCHWNGSECTKILFIADPQIQGEDHTKAPQKYIYNWDSDRHLWSTFNQAVKHFKPDILVFLGDVTDEGSIATSEQFDRYVKRLNDIFYVKYPVSRIWIPGDNDIGGEHEPIKPERVYQFNKAFSQPEVFIYNNISFFTVNKVLYRIPKAVDKDDGNLRIAVSHYTLTYGTEFDLKTYDNIRPDISFCGHEHDSKVKSMRSDWGGNMQINWFKFGDDVLKVTLGNNVFYEIFVPTCSYRMGTSHVGYGAAVIGNNNTNMEYSVLWSPERFSLLYLYAYAAGACVIIIFYCFMSKIYKTRMTKSYKRMYNSSDIY